MPTGIHRIIDQQMRRWEMANRTRKEAAKANPDLPRLIHPCITIGRMLGAGGRAISERLSESLGYPVFDREILEFLLREGRIRGQLIELLDERDRSALDIWLQGIIRGKLTDKGDYLRTLVQVLGSIAAQGPAVIVGRGANFILESHRTLHVRLVAPFSERVAAVAQNREIPRAEAEEVVQKSDRERAAFIEHHFHRNIDDPLAYDLILNTGEVSAEAAAELIQLGLRRKLGQ